MICNDEYIIVNRERVPNDKGTRRQDKYTLCIESNVQISDLLPTC